MWKPKWVFSSVRWLIMNWHQLSLNTLTKSDLFISSKLLILSIDLILKYKLFFSIVYLFLLIIRDVIITFVISVLPLPLWYCVLCETYFSSWPDVIKATKWHTLFVKILYKSIQLNISRCFNTLQLIYNQSFWDQTLRNHCWYTFLNKYTFVSSWMKDTFTIVCFYIS